MQCLMITSSSMHEKEAQLNSLEGSEEIKSLVNQFCYNCYVLFPQVSSLIGNYESMYKFILPVNFFCRDENKNKRKRFLKSLLLCVEGVIGCVANFVTFFLQEILILIRTRRNFRMSLVCVILRHDFFPKLKWTSCQFWWIIFIIKVFCWTNKKSYFYHDTQIPIISNTYTLLSMQCKSCLTYKWHSWISKVKSSVAVVGGN